MVKKESSGPRDWVSFWRSPAPPSTPGDIDDDGDVDLTDLATLLADFGCSTAPCTGDLTGDGVTGLADLSLLLANFGSETRRLAFLIE